MKKRFALVLALLLLLLSGCAQPAKVDQPQNTDPTSGLSGELSLYYPRQIDFWYQAAIADFQQKNPDVAITAEAFDSFAEMDQRLMSEWGGGRGPDIALFTSSTTLDMRRLTENGVFQDVSEHFSEFNNLENTYHDAAWQAGTFDGKKYLFPIALSAYSLTTSEETMAALGAAITNKTDFSGVISAFHKAILATKDEPMKLGMDAVSLPYDASALPDLLRMHGGFSISGAAGDMAIDQDALKAIADFQKLRIEANQAKEAAIYDAYRSSNQAALYKSAGIRLMRRNPFLYARTNDTFFTTMAETPVYLPMPTQDGTVPATLEAYGVIKAGSESGRLATAFLHTFASVEAYKDFGIDWIPANKQVALNYISLLALRNGKDIEFEPKRFVRVLALTAERRQQLTDWYLGIDDVQLINPKIDQMITETLSGYLSDTASFDSAYADLVRRLSLYSNE